MPLENPLNRNTIFLSSSRLVTTALMTAESTFAEASVTQHTAGFDKNVGRKSSEKFEDTDIDTDGSTEGTEEGCGGLIVKNRRLSSFRRKDVEALSKISTAESTFSFCIKLNLY